MSQLYKLAFDSVTIFDYYIIKKMITYSFLVCNKLIIWRDYS